MTLLLLIILGASVALIAKEYLYDERDYYRDFEEIKEKKKNIKCCSKVSKDKIQCKCKLKSIKETSKVFKRWVTKENL